MFTIDLSICIVNYNARYHLTQCIHSIIDVSDDLRYEIIVVDNGSTDGSVELIRTQFPGVRIIENTSNFGFVTGTNQAMSCSQGRFILWLNNDTLLKRGALSTLVSFLEQNAEVGICGPKVLNRDNTIQNQCRRGFPTPWASFCYFLGLSRLFPDSPVFSQYLLTYFGEDETREVDAVSGACLLVRRSALDKVGFIDSDYFAYGEDLDFCARVKQAGWQVVYHPQAEIVHFGGQGGSGVRPYQSIYHFYRSMWLFYRKHLSSKYVFLLNWAIVAVIWVKFSLAIIVNLLRKQKTVGSAKP